MAHTRKKVFDGLYAQLRKRTVMSSFSQPRENRQSFLK